MAYYKIQNEEENSLDISYIKTSKEGYMGSVLLVFNKKHRNLIESAIIKEEKSELIEFDISPDNPDIIEISFNEYESAVKRAINHILRELKFSDYFLTNANNLDKDLTTTTRSMDEVLVIKRF